MNNLQPIKGIREPFQWLLLETSCGLKPDFLTSICKSLLYLNCYLIMHAIQIIVWSARLIINISQRNALRYVVLLTFWGRNLEEDLFEKHVSIIYNNTKKKLYYKTQNDRHHCRGWHVLKALLMNLSETMKIHPPGTKKSIE